MTPPGTTNPEIKETTGSGQILYEPTGTQTAAGSAVLAREYGLLRDQVGVLNDDVNEAHRQVQRYDLDERARTEAKKSVPTLLEELSDHRGMAWRDIARLVGVSVSAVRKWRHDGPAAPEKRLALAKLAAFLDLLEGFMVEDPASWLELPMVDGYTVRHIDLYEGGRPDLLLDVVDIRLKETAALDLFDPDWRTRYRSDFEVFEAGDGNLSIRKR
jgi:transcriptional regulator with XRE-family HTH domain